MLSVCLPAVFTNSACLFSVEKCIKMCGLEAYADIVVGSLLLSIASISRDVHRTVTDTTVTIRP